MRGDHFRQRADFLAELLGVAFVVPFHLDADEDGQAQADFVRRQPGLVAQDHAGFLQHAHAAQARRGRQADLLGKLHIGQAAVLLQCLENAPVIGV
ncbi:hypothetical protein D3C72_2154820 [compost metagenome]